MIDAISFEDSDAPSSRSTRSYTLRHEIPPPTIVEPKERIDAMNHVMGYTVLHPHEGVICGPDVVFTGRKVPEVHKAKKAQILEKW